MQKLDQALPMPREWPAATHEEGVMQIATAGQEKKACAALKKKSKMAKKVALTALSEAALTTAFLRTQANVTLPVVLVSEPDSCQFVQRHGKNFSGLWDECISFDARAAHDTLVPLAPIALANASFAFVCKLLCLARSPFRRTVFLDADIWVTSRRDAL